MGRYPRGGGNAPYLVGYLPSYIAASERTKSGV